MLPRSTIHRLIPILRKDAGRALRMKVPGFPRVYYCSFLLRDLEWFNTWASSGSIYRRRSDHTRNVYADIRVGSYRYDQTTDGGLTDNDRERESVSHVTVPIDDRHYDGLRLALWRLTESKFREALKDYSNKESGRISTPDHHAELASFVRLPRKVDIAYGRRQKVDEERWVRFVKKASKWIAELPNVSTSWVEFDSSQETKLFVSTEGRILAQHSTTFSLTATIRKLTSEGATIEQEVVINCADVQELPTAQKFRKMVLEKHRQLLRLARARQLHSFSGPVLLYPHPAGLLFHEAVGHRLEGSRLLSADEGQTFRGLEGKRVLNVDIDVIDNPRLTRFRGERCVGAYHYDDEGTPAKSAVLIEGGVLRGFVNTRAPTVRRKFEPNGHARSRKFQRPVSRMGVFMVRGKETVSMPRLRELLIDEIKRQKKPFGLIVYQTSGGETDTTSYDFQAFSGEISYATLVYPDGRETVVRGVNLVGTPLQALNNIIAVGDSPELDNGFCGAESGLVPVSTISPAVLLSNLELQAKNEELVSQNILPRPKL
jgi:TldD protein